MRSHARLRNLVAIRVEPATEIRPVLNLDGVGSGSGRIVTDLTTRPIDQGIRLEPGDVIFSKLRPYLAKSALIDRPLNGTGEFLVLAPGASIEARFLLYVTLSKPWLEYSVETSYGAKMPRTSWEAMSDYRLPNLTISEQRRIADFLDDQVARIDKIVAAREKQTELEDAALTARLRELLLEGSTVPARRLLREAVVGIVVQPSKYYVEEAEPGVPALRGLNVVENKILTENLVAISQEGHRFHPRSRLGSGDVVVVRTGDAGAACVVPEWANDWNAIDLVVLRTIPDVDPGYLAYALNASRRDQSIAAASSGSIQQHFGVGAVGDLPIVFREPEEQARVVAHAADAYSIAGTRRELLNHSITLLRELKRALITAAVNGEFDVATADGSQVPV